MHIPTSFFILTAFLLPALAAPVPQEGNNQIEEFNVSPTPQLPSATAAATPSTTPASIDPLQQPKKPKIDAKDGMATGMGAAMAGVGQATQALSSLPLVGSLAGSAGGLGARDIEVKHKKRLLESLPLLGSILGGGGKVKRGTVDSALYPKLQNLPDVGSAGLINLGSNNKRELPLAALKGLPLVGTLLGKVKRQLDVLKSLPIVGSMIGGKTKREASPGPQLDLLKGVPIVGGMIGGKPPKVKRTEFGLDGIKKVVATVADIRGVTSKREAAPTPEDGDFRQELRKANKAKVNGELSKAADKAERKVKIKNTKFPPNGGKVKSPKEALDKREDPMVEKRGGLDTLPVKDIAESMTGLKSALDLLKSANAAMQNVSGK